MALRVLLADESSTIKKVFQLALQDFAVEVKPVALGIDVHAVASDFQPDIVFADILLQKKNGYDACAELKSDSQLKSIPVVLMWSGFMELDQDKFEACGADGQLEKPFDVAQLRKVVQDLVSKTKTQSLANYLDFPEPDQEDPPQAPPVDEPKEESDEFEAVPFKTLNKQNENFRLKVEDLDEDEAVFTPEPSHEPPPIKQEVRPPSSEPSSSNRYTRDDESEPDLLEVEEVEEDFEFHRTSAGIANTDLPRTRREPAPSSSDPLGLKPEEIREIVERLAPKIIEDIAWKIVPDLAAQIIERELKSLLAEKDNEVSP
ncbi:response regulator [bacterium]|nr:response regulator [bacterium]